MSITRPVIRRTLLAPVALAAAAAALALTPAAASASSSPTPISPTYCNGDLCIRIYLPANAPSFAKIEVHEWADSYTFYGHFELLVPRDSHVFNSADTTNKAGGSGPWFIVPNNDGRFTAHAWLRTGSSSWGVIGTTGFDGAYI